MLDVKILVRSFEDDLRSAANLSDFFLSAHAQESLGVIIQQMSLEVMRRVKTGESLDELREALLIMDESLKKAILLVPEMLLLILLKNSSAINLLLFMTTAVGCSTYDTTSASPSNDT